jgi:hypothetical protein
MARKTATVSREIRTAAKENKPFPPIGEQRFRTAFKWYDGDYKSTVEIEVSVMTAAEWLALPDRAYCWWGAQLLDNGCVIACRAKAKGHEECSRSGDKVDDVEQIAVLRMFRARLLEFLEAQPDLERAELTTGGDARFELRADFVGHQPAVEMDVFCPDM